MSFSLPTSLTEIYPLRFRLREELRYTREQDVIVAAAIQAGHRYALQRWQFEMLIRLDGQTPFDQVSMQVFALLPDGFTATGLYNFYRWLYDEDLILCDYETVFELVADEEESVMSGAVVIPFTSRKLSDPWVANALKIAAALILSLCVIRFVLFAAPLQELPVDGNLAESAPQMKPVSEEVSATGQRVIEPAAIQKIEIATQVKE